MQFEFPHKIELDADGTVNYETPFVDVRRKCRDNWYALMEHWLIEEGITSYFEWADRLELAFPGRGKSAVEMFERVLVAGTDYINGKIKFGNCFDGQYDDILSTWAVWCLEQNDALKKAIWI